MRDLIGRERAVIGVVTAVVAAALVYSMDRLMVDGILTWEMGQREYLALRKAWLWPGRRQGSTGFLPWYFASRPRLQ